MDLAHSGRLLTALAALLAYVLTPSAPSCWADLTGSSFPDALLAIGTLIAIVISWWILLVVALASLAPSAKLVRWLAPAVVRRALFVGAAGALVVTPAYAEQAAPQVDQHSTGQHSVAGLQLPDRPLTGSAPTGSESARTASAPARTPTSPLSSPTSITVAAGDSLWTVAARSLPADASVADIAAHTRRWHEANRAVIGADPHVLFPGQQLTPPVGKDLP